MKHLQMMMACWLLGWNASAESSTPRIYSAVERVHLVILDRLVPQQILGDFNGDGKKDEAVFVKDPRTNKEGLCILHSGETSCILIGAGNNFYAAGDDLSWVNRWSFVPPGYTWETVVDSSGELHGRKKIKIPYGSIRLCMDEAGCGIISLQNGKYFWIHQSD